MSAPFNYPDQPHVRRHGPFGYADYASFRPWLRDEFAFRCVFCLRRESWGQMFGEFAIDHFLPVKHYPDRATDYENLLYVCGPCNLKKGERFVSDPLVHLLSDRLELQADGTFVAKTRESLQVVEVMQLNRPDVVEFRALWIGLLKLAADHDPNIYRRILGFPDELPDLSILQPPGGNIRPEGIPDSFFSRRQRGELPETY
jgi:hypothetical protein